MVLGFVLALWVSRVGRGRVFYQTMLMLPILLPGIVIGAIWKLIYNPEFGIINLGLAAIGLHGADWLGDPALAFMAVVVVDIWHWTPFVFLLLLAAIESLPGELFEAARVDGASRWQELRRDHAAADAPGDRRHAGVPTDRLLQGLRRGLPADGWRSWHDNRSA